jgi:hypothetical protein
MYTKCTSTGQSFKQPRNWYININEMLLKLGREPVYKNKKLPRTNEDTYMGLQIFAPFCFVHQWSLLMYGEADLYHSYGRPVAHNTNMLSIYVHTSVHYLIKCSREVNSTCLSSMNHSVNSPDIL